MKKLLLNLLIVLALSGGAWAVITDPLYIAVGARAMGMGKTGVATLRGADAIFLNPAGLAQLKNPQVSSMYTNLFQDIRYFVLGGGYPTGLGIFGAGYIGAQVGDILIADASIDINRSPNFSIATHNTNVFILSYAAALEKEKFNEQEVFFGANFKFFNQGAEGISAMGINGSGFDADLGLIYIPVPWANLGLNFQNALPSTTIGGTMFLDDGAKESIPAVLKLGSMLKIRDNLTFAMDADFSVKRRVPTTYHIGFDWWPIKNAGFRMGLDQDPLSASDVTTNYTLGIGFKMKDLELDYAFHPYNPYSELASHYISFSIDFPAERKKKSR